MADLKGASVQKGGPASRQARQKKDEEVNLEVLVGELELRVDRLRACYDQYFMGIEKMPPHVQLKDVERRLQDLRKVQIRNTALRFKFQTTLQRYNTYQSYWQRICRQIEEGTYKRDLRRANERFGKNAAKRGAAKDLEIDIEFDDLMASDNDDIEAMLSASLTELDAPGQSVRPASDAPKKLAAAAAAEGIPVVMPRGPAEERPSQKHLARTDGKASLPPVSPPPPPPVSRAPGLVQLAAPKPKSNPPRVVPPGEKPAVVAAPTQPSPRPLVKPASLIKPPIVPQASLPKPEAPPPPSGRVPSKPPPPVPQRSVVRPSTGAAPPIQPARPPAPAPSASSLLEAAMPRPADAAKPPVSAPKPAAPVAAASRPRPAAPPAAAPKPKHEGDLSDERVRQLYAQYVETKRAHKESTAMLSFDSLAKSLRDSSEKLKEKHKGKKVDFEVTVKDGKTILRPVVKDAR